MRQPAEANRPVDLYVAHKSFRMMISSSAWVPTMKS
jgi:hypothetical protein